MASRMLNIISRVARNAQFSRSMSIYGSAVNFHPASNKNMVSLTRKYSSCFPEIATYEEIKGLPYRPNTLLIDVREPSELKETGAVPTSINIPLGEVSEKLSKDFPAEEFKKIYNRNKPAQDSEIIFMCKIGRRSHSALEISRTLGYKNGRNYLGSWQEWSNNEGLSK